MRKYIPYNPHIFTHVSVVFTFITVYLFYCQSLDLEYLYGSDLPVHVKSVSNDGYSLLHFVVSAIGNVLALSKVSKLVLFPIVMILTLAASIYLSLVLIRDYLKNSYATADPYKLDFLTFALMLVSMIIINPFAEYLYLGQGTPNPWHNPTNIFCKPFSILAFIYLVKSYANHRAGRSNVKNLVLLSAFALLSMWAKPAFLLSLLPATAAVFVFLFFKKRISFGFLLTVAIALLPSLIPQFLTYQKVYDAQAASSGIVFLLGGAWRHYSDNIPLSILLAGAFPLFVFFTKIREASLPFILAFVNYVFAILLFSFLAEEGPRMLHANFGWPYLMALFFLFLTAAEEFFLRRNWSGISFKVGAVLFSLHLLSGLFYFTKVLFGFGYE